MTMAPCRGPVLEKSISTRLTRFCIETCMSFCDDHHDPRRASLCANLACSFLHNFTFLDIGQVLSQVSSISSALIDMADTTKGGRGRYTALESSKDASSFSQS